VLDERPAVPRISDLGHLVSSSMGKLELDLMGSHQISEQQVLDAIQARRSRGVRRVRATRTGWRRSPTSSPRA
jgi:magnesium chelatase subunit I